MSMTLEQDMRYIDRCANRVCDGLDLHAYHINNLYFIQKRLEANSQAPQEYVELAKNLQHNKL